MLQVGKVQMLDREMERLGIDICGLSETRWKSSGHFRTLSGHQIAFSDTEQQGQYGVAIWMNKEAKDALIGYDAVSDRIICARFEAKPKNLTVVQAYAPTSAASQADRDAFYAELSMTLRRTEKKDQLILMGDFNAKVGDINSQLANSEGIVGTSHYKADRLVS